MAEVDLAQSMMLLRLEPVHRGHGRQAQGNFGCMLQEASSHELLQEQLGARAGAGSR